MQISMISETKGTKTPWTQQHSRRALAQNRTQVVKFALATVEFMAPAELKLETGRLVQTLAQRPEGLTKDQLLCALYENYEAGSFTMRKSLEACLDKLIQRSRPRFRPFGLEVVFCPVEKVWLLAPIEAILERRSIS